MFFGQKGKSQKENNERPAGNTGSDRPPSRKQGGVKAVWRKLSPANKRRLVMGAIVTALIVAALAGYKVKYGDKGENEGRKAAPGGEGEQVISMKPELIEKSLYTRALDMVEEQDREIGKLKERIEALKSRPARVVVERPPAPPVPPPPADIKKPEPRKKEEQRGLLGQLVPPGPKQPGPGSSAVPPPPEKEAVQLVGGIKVTKNVEKAKAARKKKGDKKKAEIYLPPSFMEATLLSGVAAPTTQAAKGNPLPVLLRIKDLAVLPNKVKANLKGCFAIGEATGNLADERVHIRLLTLSCVAKNGKAVIDQAVKGFVVDGDGKVGLAGRVVAKMGIHIARSALVGFLAGFGDAAEAAASDRTFSPVLGTTTQIWTETDTRSMVKSGIGKGVSTAAKELQKFYLQLAEQTLPVIEVGSTKTVTLVISEGVSLEIKKQNLKT